MQMVTTRNYPQMHTTRKYTQMDSTRRTHKHMVRYATLLLVVDAADAGEEPPVMALGDAAEEDDERVPVAVLAHAAGAARHALAGLGRQPGRRPRGPPTRRLARGHGSVTRARARTRARRAARSCRRRR
jgi:hypothetical protein